MTEQQLQLGVSKDIITLSNYEQVTSALLDLINQSRLRIRIASHDLQPHIYNSDAVCQALASVISQNQRMKVEVLIQDVDAVVKADHGLVKLMRQLSSYVEIRKTAPVHSHKDLAYTLIDDYAYLQGSSEARREFKLCYNSRRKVRDMNDDFRVMWEQSLRVSEFLRLYL